MPTGLEKSIFLYCLSLTSDRGVDETSSVTVMWGALYAPHQSHPPPAGSGTVHVMLFLLAFILCYSPT